jgi:hypothetical protein
MLTSKYPPDKSLKAAPEGTAFSVLREVFTSSLEEPSEGLRSAY